MCGSVHIWKTRYPAAFVFTAYDGSGNVNARAARPGDNEYYRTEGRHGFGFTLDPAGSLPGGIQRMSVDLWERDAYGDPFISDTADYYRP